MAKANFKESNNDKSKRSDIVKSGFDLPFFVITMLILVFGLIMMFSASYAYAYYTYGDSFYYIKRQLLWAVVGVFAMMIVANIDYKIYHKLALPLMVISTFLLIIVLFLPRVNGVKRWINLGFTTVQPSEIAKLAIILVFAHIISLNHKNMKTFRIGVLPFMVLLGVTAGLMVLEPHLSGTILIVLIGMTLMLVGGTSLKWFGIGGGLIAAVLLYLVMFTNVIAYAMSRLQHWINPFLDAQGNGYQTIQSLYAIGSGGLMGLGLGNSRQKYLYIPEPQNDFVFSIVCEELGLIGATIIIILFALLVWRGFVIAMRSPDKFGALITIGIVTQVGIQAALNIAVVTNTVPNTGISLPFFSYGGTALMMLLFEMGIVLAVSRYSSQRR